MKLPEYNEKTGLIPESPPGVDLNPASYGQVARVASDIGDKLAGLGQALLEKRQQASDNDFGYTQSESDRRALNDFKTQAYDQFQKSGDFTGFTKAIQDKANELFDDAQTQAPSEDAKQLYAHHASAYLTSAIIDAQKQEGLENARIQKQNILDQHDANSNQLVLSGNLNDAVMNNNSALSMLDSSKDLHVKSVDYDAIRGKILGTTAQAYYQSKFNATGPQKAAIYASALHDLQQQDNSDTADGTTEKLNKAGYVNSGLDADQRGEWVARFQKLLASENAVKTADIHSRANDDLASMYAGNTTSPNPQTIQDIKSAPNLSDDQKTSYLTQFAVAKTVGAAVNQMRLSDPKTAQAIYNAAVQQVMPDEGDSKNYVVRQHAVQMLDQSLSSLQDDKAKDGAQYVLNNFPGDRSLYERARGGDPVTTQQAASQMLARQSAVGVPNPRIMSLPDSKAMGAKIQGVDANTAGQLVTGLQKQYGPYFSQVLNEMVKDKALPEGYGIVAFTPDQTDRQALIANISNQKSITEAFNTARPKAGNDLKDEMRKVLSPCLTALNYSDPTGRNLTAANGLIQNLTLGAKKDMVANPDLRAGDAAAKQGEVLDRVFHPPISAANSTILLPRVVQGQQTNPQVIENFMQNHTYPQAFEDMKWKIPQDPMVPPDKQKERFYDTLMNTGRWVDNGNQTGIRFMYQDKKGPAFVQDTSGKPVEFLFKDIPLLPQRTLKDRKVILRQEPNGPVYMQ